MSAAVPQHKRYPPKLIVMSTHNNIDAAQGNTHSISSFELLAHNGVRLCCASSTQQQISLQYMSHTASTRTSRQPSLHNLRYALRGCKLARGLKLGLCTSCRSSCVDKAPTIAPNEICVLQVRYTMPSRTQDAAVGARWQYCKTS
jgi:hypothetical protein